MIALTKTHAEITLDDAIEHDGIMEQLTYEISLWKGALPLNRIPLKYLERVCHQL